MEYPRKGYQERPEQEREEESMRMSFEKMEVGKNEEGFLHPPSLTEFPVGTSSSFFICHEIILS